MIVEVYTPKKKRKGGTKNNTPKDSKYVTRKEFNNLSKDVKDLKSDVKNIYKLLKNFITEQRKFNAWVVEVFKKNNLKT